eukprot:4628388-Pleurochrysis_carterae.AAC.2
MNSQDQKRYGSATGQSWSRHEKGKAVVFSPNSCLSMLSSRLHKSSKMRAEGCTLLRVARALPEICLTCRHRAIESECQTKTGVRQLSQVHAQPTSLVDDVDDVSRLFTGRPRVFAKQTAFSSWSSETVEFLLTDHYFAPLPLSILWEIRQPVKTGGGLSTRVGRGAGRERQGGGRSGHRSWRRKRR